VAFPLVAVPVELVTLKSVVFIIIVVVVVVVFVVLTPRRCASTCGEENRFHEKGGTGLCWEKGCPCSPRLEKRCAWLYDLSWPWFRTWVEGIKALA